MNNDIRRIHPERHAGYALYKEVRGLRFKDGEERITCGKYRYFLCDDGVQDESDDSCCLHSWDAIAEVLV